MASPSLPSPPPVAVLTGPTGVGKTALALRLARELGAQIVNADSLQVYRELDIGTAKPSWQERAQIPHHLLDVVFPDQDFDAADYYRQGRQVLAALHQQGLPPLVVGGTGLYIRVLLHGICDDGVRDEAVRRQLREELADQGLPALYERLRRLDPAAAARLHPHDTARILRALEVAQTGGSLVASQQRHGFADSPYRTLIIALHRPREELYARINARVEAMLAQGLVAEVQDLRRRYPPSLKPLQSLGYRHVSAFFDGRLTWAEMVARLQQDTRRYAKRQLTWFRADAAVRWLHPGDTELAIRLLRDFFHPRPPE